MTEQRSHKVQRDMVWTLAVLTLFYGISFLDRQVLAVLVVPIRATLGISDFQISLVQGLAFAAFYAVFGLFMGWAVDRFERRWIIALGLSAWALATAGCGMADSFGLLLTMRFLVGAGEATLVPAAYSLLSNKVPRHRLSFYLSVFGLGSPVGAALAIFLGGWLITRLPADGATLAVVGHRASWQIIFLALGLLALPFAALAFTFREPVRTRPAKTDAGSGWRALWMVMRAERRFYICHFLGFSLLSLSGYAILQWAPTYLIRHFAISPASVGLYLSIIFTVPGIAGGILAGTIVDRWFAAGRADAHLHLYVGVALAQAAIIILGIASSNLYVVLATLALVQLLAPFSGVAAAALQLMTPAEFRGRVSSLYLFIFNMIGFGCGPSAAAFLTDYVFQDDTMVGWSIATTCGMALPSGALCLWLGRSSMRRRLG